LSGPSAGWTAALLAGAVFFSSGALGQGASLPGASERTDSLALDSAAADVPQIVVQGHYDNGVGTTDAASQGSVNGAIFRDLPLLRPAEVLETVPGLIVTQHSGDGKANQYFLRGYNLDHGTDLATHLDSVPVNMPTNAHGQGYTDLNYLIPELIERVDYRKGPYSAESGDFSAAGAVNIRYRTSLDQSFASVTAGSFDYRRALVAGSIPVKRLVPADSADAPLTAADRGPTVLGAVELEGYNGPWTTAEELNKINSLVRLSDGDAAEGWSLDATYYDARWNSTDQVPLAAIQSGQLGRFSAVDPTDGGGTGRQIVSGEWHEIAAQGYTRVSVYAQRYRLQLFSDFSFFELRPTTGDQFEQWEHRDFFGGQVVHGWNGRPFGLESITEAGLQLRRDNIHLRLSNTEARLEFEPVSDDEVGETEGGVWLQNTVRWTPWLRSQAGLRQQLIAMNMTAIVSAENSGTASGSKTLPSLSLIFGPWSRTELFLNWGKGFHSNDARGVIDRIDPTTLQTASRVPALVGATGKEVGVRTEAISGVQSSIALWSLNSDSELVYNPDSDIGSTSPNGASRRYGVEWNNHFTASRNFLLDADLAWTHTRYAVDNDNGQLGSFIPNAVPKVGVVRATVQGLGPWSIGMETRFIGSYPLSQEGKLTTPSSTVINLRMQAELSRHFDVALDVLNVLNRQYFDIAYEQNYRLSPAGPTAPDGVAVHPGEPRELRVTFRLRL
jgi:outer membrane receptor protein involved in Fe transport